MSDDFASSEILYKIWTMDQNSTYWVFEGNRFWVKADPGKSLS